jgi:hypothetical protein
LNEAPGNGRIPPNPVSVTLAVGAGGAITGKAEYPLEGCTMTLGGKEIDTPLGPQLQVQYMSGQADANAVGDAAAFMNAVQHEAWLLRPSGDPAGPMRLVGYFVANSVQHTSPVSLQLLPYTDKDKAAMVQQLTAGVQFKLVYPLMDAAATDTVAFSGDASTGEIKDTGGWAQMTMPHTPPNGRAPVYAYTVVVTPIDDGLYLNAAVYNIRQGANHPIGRWDAVQVK